MESCIGCSACVAACYMENNIPCVGEEEHLTGREMSWIRVQPYYHQDGSMDNLVMMCQQCDFAPCENVCPVFLRGYPLLSQQLPLQSAPL
jgi:molybdopterin-containing oxidoreductase family iron-sulfur binding subunit